MYFNPKATLSPTTIDIAESIPAQGKVELNAESPVLIKNIAINSKNYVVYLATTKSNQLLLSFYENGSCELKASKYLGQSVPLQAADFGRAAERILYSHLGGKGKTFISNTHFDTTRANIEFSGPDAFDIPIAEATIPSLEHPFKGNMDVDKLDGLITEKGAKNIGAVILTVTNNSGGGQPVSMKNAREVGAVCKKHGVIYILDCCRIAENSWFVKHREAGMEDKN